MAHGGEAVGRTTDGRALFVAGALPGEEVDARIVEMHRRYGRGYADAPPAVPSADRVAAPCPHFGAWPARGAASGAWCGGCQWQHVEGAAQLRFKRSILVDALTRIGGISTPNVLPILGMTSPWGYRNKLRTRLIGGRPGLVAVDGRRLVPLDACAIAHPTVLAHVLAFEADLPDGLEVTFRAGTRTGDALIVIDDPDDVVGAIDVATDASVVIVDGGGGLGIASGRSFYVESFRGDTIGVPATSFFQVNTEMAERLADAVRQALGPSPGRVVDAFCGIGTLTGALADAAAEVIAIDHDGGAIAAAVANTGGRTNVTLVEGDAAEALAEYGAGMDALVVDPPRGGLDEAARRVIAGHRPPRLIYVSCDPTTLARDVAALAAAGYAHRSTQPIDMFPQTYHSESVTVLDRGA
ncbi:MAG: TRAM domain-containing protein [Ardenticatenales bacterium]